jgi:hypothetical protein
MTHEEVQVPTLTVRRASAIALLVSSAVLATLASPGVASSTPVATDDDAKVTVGGSVLIDVLANDYDTGSNPARLQLTSVSQPAHGSTTVSQTSVEYTSDGVFVGSDSFTYEITDGKRTAEATVSVTVSDAPNQAPVVVDDVATTQWGVSVVVDVAGNDSDPEGEEVEVIAVATPAHGTAALVRGGLRYLPRGEYLGQDEVSYTVQDGHGVRAEGTLTVDVQPAFTVEVRRVVTPVAGRASTVRGAVSTRLDGPVTVSLQRWNGERWRALSTRQVRASDRFELRWRPEQPGRAVLRLAARWDQGHRAQSPREPIAVEARFEPDVQRVTAKDVPHTWRPGCPVGPAGLRAIRMNHWDYRGRLQRGTLIGATHVVADYIAVFRRAFETKFPIKKMYPADRYGGVDERAMRAGNTSAFNCRHVTGNPYRMSQHSYGNAIDINTFENPYVTGSRIYPPKAAVPYYHRRQHNLGDPGVITSRSSIARALWARGWAWGARWSLPDYQHWSSNGG